MTRLNVFVFVVGVAWIAAADIVITSPLDGETVEQLYPMQLKFVMESQAERAKYFDGKKNAVSLKKDGSRPKPIDLAWTGANGDCRVTVRRMTDGKVFFTCIAKGGTAKVDSLEIARQWELAVSDGKTEAKVRFWTADRAPRLININDKIANCRDIGGRFGWGGRRIRQGLVYRTQGLNGNAPVEYYKNDEIMELYRTDKLKSMGTIGRKLNSKLKAGGQLHSNPLKNKLVKREKFALGEQRMTAEEIPSILARWGFKSDIDLRRDQECYGMTGSPLGDSVTWFHYPYVAYCIESKECNRKVFGVFLDPKNYPIVFHCIGGADRTGTVALLLEALLGVDENNLLMDYQTTGFVGVVTDPKHRDSIGRVFNDLKKYPGNTWSERAEAYFRTIGYTDRDIAFLRDFLLESS